MQTATSEITALQDNTAKLNASNDFNGTNIADANLQLTTEQYHNIGTVVSGLNISFLNGHYQSVIVNLDEGTSSINFNLADWPDRDGLAKMTVQFFGNNTAKEVTFTVDGGGTIKKNSTFPTTFVVDSSTDPIIVDFWTYSSGTIVYAEYKGRFEA